MRSVVSRVDRGRSAVFAIVTITNKDYAGVAMQVAAEKPWAGQAVR
jgi:hypothetical protein